jgi:hypothetical protein
MNIPKGKVAIGLATKMLEQSLQRSIKVNFIDKLSLKKSFPVFPGNDELLLSALVDINLKPVFFSPHRATRGTPFNRLNIGGSIKLRVASNTAESPVLINEPFEFVLILESALKRRTGLAPVLSLNYVSIEAVSGPFSSDFLTSYMIESGAKNALSTIEFDVISPLIDGLEEVLYFNVPSKPKHSDYAVALHKLEGASGVVDCFALIIDAPGGDVNLTNPKSFVPKRSEIIIHFSSSLIQGMVNTAKDELKTYFEQYDANFNLTIDRLDVRVEDNQFYLDAKVTEHDYDASGTIKGPIKLHHRPGSLKLYLDMRSVEIDIDLPWWADLAVYLLGYNDEVHEKYPNMAQVFAEKMANSAISKITNAIQLDGIQVANLPLIVYPDYIQLAEGAITCYIQVIINPIHEKIVRADYFKLRKRFDRFYLESGRAFMYNDLARFMNSGLIVCPGFHDVDGRYVRSNPDNTEGNNLLSLFGR